MWLEARIRLKYVQYLQRVLSVLTAEVANNELRMWCVVMRSPEYQDFGAMSCPGSGGEAVSSNVQTMIALYFVFDKYIQYDTTEPAFVRRRFNVCRSPDIDSPVLRKRDGIIADWTRHHASDWSERYLRSDYARQ